MASFLEVSNKMSFIGERLRFFRTLPFLKRNHERQLVPDFNLSVFEQRSDLKSLFEGYNLNLPHEWRWAQIDEVILDINSGWSPKCENELIQEISDWGVLKTTAVQQLSFQPNEHKKLPDKLEPRPEHLTAIGDILITRAGPKNRVGIVCAVNQEAERLMISDKIIRLKLIDEVDPNYIALALSTDISAAQFGLKKTGMADSQVNISQAVVKKILIPLPPLETQLEISQQVAQYDMVMDKAEATLRREEIIKTDLLKTLVA